MFNKWINQKYEEWQLNKTRKDSTIAMFATEFGASQSIMSRWMRPGSNPPKSPKYLNALEKKYDGEFLEVLGIEKSNAVSIDLAQIPPGLRARLQEAVQEMITSYASRHIAPDSPEALQLASQIFAAHGFNVTDIENDNSG